MATRSELLQRARERRSEKVIMVRCPLCDGFGSIWNRFTHAGQVCPVCEGKGKINPKRANESS